MACLVHQGGDELLPEAYSALMSWTQANGYRVTGPNRDIFLRSPHQRPSMTVDRGPASGITEVQFPVEKKPISTFIIGQTEKTEMEPKIVTKPAFTVVGMLYHGKNEKNEIAQMWSEFMPRIGEIQNIVGNHESYGVCSDLEPEGLFEYVAGVPVAKAEDIPEGMVSWDVPDQQYAVFSCTLPTIHEAYNYAFETWLPQSEYQRGDGPDFEHYDASFNPDEKGPLYIYIPIK
jgi:AraC family transcriptional regulator